MLETWQDRSVITANLLNPAFCGEVLRRSISAYNDNDDDETMPYSLLCIILPVVLHKATRDKMPLRTSTYFHSWVDSNEYLFLNFGSRVKQLLPYTKESILFLLKHKAVFINEGGKVEISVSYRKKNPRGENIEEVKQILKKAELIGKWLRLTGNPQTIYMFLKIQP